ncbi:hypothetical protein [Lysobacter sp. Root667]|uniref:hypothetical protein n=1 Tax=Lysobacter sp. Root667 TaxID=1736581 RepID=UPI000AEBEBE0|nr:hypothetical protein [Lysobacter sp. Root667]
MRSEQRRSGVLRRSANEAAVVAAHGIGLVSRVGCAAIPNPLEIKRLAGVAARIA